MTQVLAVILLLLLLTVLVAAYAGRRARDRCLKGFAGDYVTIEFKDGTRAFGRLQVFAGALELRYDRPRRRRDGHVESSLVLFPDQMRRIQSIRRYGEELVEGRRHARQREIEDAYHPLLWRRVARGVRGGWNTLRDALAQTAGALVAHLRKSPPPRLKKGLREGGEPMPTPAPANSYEAILEHYLGHQVVIEERRSGGPVTHAGVLVDYTADWLQVVDCRRPERHYLPLAEVERLRLCRDLRLAVHLARDERGYHLEIDFRNLSDKPCVLRGLAGEGYEHPIGVEVAPGDGVRCTVDDLPEHLVAAARHDPAHGRNGEDGVDLPSLTVLVDAQRRTDLCLPRGVAVVRHAGEDVA
jgi:hypothetical protein